MPVSGTVPKLRVYQKKRSYRLDTGSDRGFAIKEEKWPRITRITRIWRQDKVFENRIRAIRVIRGHFS